MSDTVSPNAGLREGDPALDRADDLATVRAAIPSCALDDEGLRRQRERQARLAPSVARVAKTGPALSIWFAPGFDRDALEAMLAVERRCCPFFVFHLDERERRLDVTVRDDEHVPALEALAHNFGAASRPA